MSELTDRIRLRCIECGDCLEWTGATSKKGGMYVSDNGKKKLVRRVMWEEKNGPIPEGKLIVSSCRNDRCVLHLQAITKTQHNKRLADAGWWSTPAYRAKMSRAMAGKSKLSDEAVAEIRAFEGYVPEIAAVHGITESYAYMLRRGVYRPAPANPFAGLGSRA